MSELEGATRDRRRVGRSRAAAHLRWLAGSVLALLVGASEVLAQSVTIAIDRSSVTAVAANVSGANVASPASPVNFGDPAVRSFAKPLQTGILRWPGGTVSDFFDWQTALIPAPATGNTAKTPTPIDIERAVFAPVPAIPFNGEVQKAVLEFQPIMAGKGGNPLGQGSTGFAGLAGALGAKFLIVVNATTDTVDDVGRLAATVARQKLPVAGFELVNEPFFIRIPTSAGAIKLPPGAPQVPGAYTDGVDYLTKMKPYQAAIKQAFVAAGVDPARAVVAIAGGYAADTDAWNIQWMQDIANYTRVNGAYWDAVAFHFYPTQASSGTFSDAMTYANDGLANGTDGFIAAYRAAPWSRGKPLFLSEYDVTFNDTRMNGSVYAGLFCAEYVARMSLYPETADLLMHQLFNTINGIGVPTAAIDGTGDWKAELEAAGAAGRPIDTTGRIKGMFYNAQILGLGLADAAVNVSDDAFRTQVSGAFGSVPTRTGTLPAVYAQAYHGRDGTIHVIVTNKGPDAKLLQLVVDGKAVTASLTMDSLAPSAGDPSQQNTSAAQPVAVRHATIRGAVTLPGYGVAHLAFHPS